MKKGNDDLFEIENLAVDSKAEVVEKLSKYLATAKNPYWFNVSGANVKIVFSNRKNAPDIESALVKIASNRGK